MIEDIGSYLPSSMLARIYGTPEAEERHTSKQEAQATPTNPTNPQALVLAFPSLL